MSTYCCISCGEPLDYPSGDGCAVMSDHRPDEYRKTRDSASKVRKQYSKTLWKIGDKMGNWHYQVMKNTDEAGNEYYAMHEYFPMEDGHMWTENPVKVVGESIEDLKTSLMNMLLDIDKHGVVDYE